MFDGVLARGGVAPLVSDEAWLRAMLAAEVALARSRRLPGPVVAAIMAECAVPRFDVRELGERAAASGNPVVPLVETLRERLEGAAAEEVHRGATSQDILDTAAMLVVRDALGPLGEDLAGAADAAAALARRHRATPSTARTLLQQAVSTSFGLKAAGWMAGLDAAGETLDSLVLAAQLGGPAGTLDGLGPDVLARFAAELGLAEPVLPWHTERSRIAAIAAALGTAAGAVAKTAGDVVLLAQTEVGEVCEAAPGGSSSMPHKRNPVAAVSARACARQAPGLAATLLASMEQEHERAAGAWHAEWAPLRALLVHTGSAASWLRTCLEGLQVDADRMRANLGEADDGAIASAAALVDRALAARVQPS